MNNRFTCTIFSFLFLLTMMIPGCTSGPEPEPRVVNIPGWLNTSPKDNQYFYAVGVSGQTRNVKDAWNQAAHRARAELGKTIITHVTSHDLTISSTQGEYTQQLIETLSDTELNFTEIVERWYDREGDYGPPNHYYVLVRLDKKRAEVLLNGLK